MVKTTILYNIYDEIGVIDNDQMTMIPLQIASDFRSCLLKIGTLMIDNLKANCKVFHQLSTINTLDQILSQV